MSSNNNKLSSSLPSNPNSRNSEVSNPMRRSFTGNPFSKPSVIANPRTSFANTPANSPSDFPRKSSVGIRESGGSFVDDKENGKDQILKPAKVRSPAVCSKATKNFMAPTISASFKVAESPRKKILTERNDPAPPTPSSDPKINARKVTFADPLEQKRLDASLDENCIPFPNFEKNSQDFGGESESLHDMDHVPMDHPDLLFDSVPIHDANVPLIPVNDIHTDSSFENVTLEPDFVNLDPTFKLSPPPAAATPVSSMAPVLDPLDANDPLMPPYDPKTNYLSPRPQFLHYRPKPHIGLCDQRELEGSFLSESFSETEFTEDTQSEESQKESEDVSSDEPGKQIEDQISEPSSLPKKTLEAKEVPKTRFSLRSKAVALILLLAVAFVSMSVSNSPGIDQMFEDFYEAYESAELPEFARVNFDQFSQFAKANVDSLTRNLHIWFTKWLSSISELVSNVGGAHSFAQLQYFNLTVLQDYSVVSGYPVFGHGENAVGDYHLPVPADVYFEDISAEHYEVFEEQLEQDMGITTEVENPFDALESEEVQDGQPSTVVELEPALHLAEVENLDAKLAQEVDASFNAEDDNSEIEEILEGQSSTWTEPEQGLQLIGAGTSDENQSPKDDDNSNVENEPDSTLEDAEFHNKVCGESNEDTKQAQESDAKLIDDDKAVGESASSDAVVRGNGQLLETIHIPQGMVLYLLLCAGAVCIAGAAFNRSTKVKSRSKKITGSEEQQPKNDEFVLSEKNRQISPEKPSLRNGPVEMDVLGESCPSEMSSFENENSSSSYSRKVVNEANSIEKKRRNSHNRRESLASSSDYSIGSQSYGSLTVYQKIPKVRGEEEVITPVRRSSRIRNLATSPA